MDPVENTVEYAIGHAMGQGFGFHNPNLAIAQQTMIVIRLIHVKLVEFHRD